MRFFICTSLILLLTACASVMYYPMKENFYEPIRFSLLPENVYFKNSDGQTLHGWWFDAKTEKPKGTFVFFHGNAENISSHFVLLSWLPEEGYNYFIFDYPGFGESQGKPDPRSNVISGEAALRWVHQNKDPSPLIVYGQSIGGTVAMRVVPQIRNEVPIKALVVDGSFHSFQQMGRRMLARSWLSWPLQPFSYLILSDAWAPDLTQITPTPFIVMHGEKDPVIEFRQGQEIFAKAKEPKTFIDIPKGQHGNGFWVEQGKYRKQVLDQLAAIPINP